MDAATALCAIDSTRYSGFLTTIASHGFLVMGTVPVEGAARRQETADDVRAAIDWAGKENARSGSPLKGKIAVDKVAVMGQSCGGFLSIALGADPRVKTIGVFNSGVQNAAAGGPPSPQPGSDALPKLPGVQLGVAYQAAGDLAVGGDFYFFRPTPDEGAVFGLGDVCGKGAEALAESGRVQHSLAALMITEQDPTQLLYLLNRALLAAGRTVFTTLVLGALRPAGEAHQLTLATGGHPAPMVLRRGGQVEEVTVPGTVVGILPDARFGRTKIALHPGETLLLYSDGVTEAGRPGAGGQEQFGSARLAACLRDCAGMTAQAVASRVERTIAGWLGRNDGDDLAVLALRAVERGG